MLIMLASDRSDSDRTRDCEKQVMLYPGIMDNLLEDERGVYVLVQLAPGSTRLIESELGNMQHAKVKIV